MKDYYYILGVIRTSSAEEIKKAYKKLSVKFHPDKNDGDHFFEDRFKEIQEAYDILKDNLKKSNYDFKLNQYQGKQNNSDSNNKVPIPSILYFNITPNKVKSGSEITIEWSVVNAKVISITGLGLVESMGKRVVRIHNKLNVETKTITLYAENSTEAKINKEICIRFETHISNQPKKYNDDNIPLSNLYFTKIKNNIFTKGFMRLSLISIIVISLIFFVKEFKAIEKVNFNTQTKSVNKNKDKFYWRVFSYLRLENSNISDEEVFIKTSQFRKIPEVFYANYFSKINMGRKITKKNLENISKSDNIKLDFDKVPDHLKGY